MTGLCYFIGEIFLARRASRKSIILTVIAVIGGYFIYTVLSPAWTHPPEVYRRMQCRSQIRQIVRAMHNYHDDYGCFPPAYVADKNGNRMHSWRTLLLPYLDEVQLYNQYKFNEPWNGPNNSKLSKIPVRMFTCPSSKKPETPITSYVAVTGPGTIWPGQRGTKKEDVADGLRNTIILVEAADSGTHWMEPRDMTIEEALGKSDNTTAQVPTSNHNAAESHFVTTFLFAGHIALADEDCRFLLEQPSPQDLEALLSIDGGESVDLECIEYAPSTEFHIPRWDRIFGLPLFLVTLVWLWIRMVEEPGKLRTRRSKK